MPIVSLLPYIAALKRIIFYEFFSFESHVEICAKVWVI